MISLGSMAVGARQASMPNPVTPSLPPSSLLNPGFFLPLGSKAQDWNKKSSLVNRHAMPFLRVK